jgi:hypothetical protein
MVEIYLVNETKYEYIFLHEGYHVEIAWLFKSHWDITDKVFVMNMNECGLIIDDQEELYKEIIPSELN